MLIHWSPLQQQADADLNGKGTAGLITHLRPPRDRVLARQRILIIYFADPQFPTRVFRE